jgi:hypothetical protein
MWYVDGSPEMVLVGVLHAGEITALNGRVGDEFVFTDSSDKENVLNHFTLRADKVRYITYTLCAKPLNITHESYTCPQCFQNRLITVCETGAVCVL